MDAMTLRDALEDLGGKQKKIYFYIKEFIEENGYPPAIRDICQAVDLKSTSTVHGHLSRLEKKGLIKRDPDRNRAIILTGEENTARSKVMTLPVIGKVTAGLPILAYENIEDYLPLPASFVHDENSFVLRVQGVSMINAGIHDGDYIVVHKQSYADDGDIVVAMIGEEATVKRIFYEGKQIRLQPENSTMEPLVYVSAAVQVIGRVCGLFRRIR